MLACGVCVHVCVCVCVCVLSLDVSNMGVFSMEHQHVECRCIEGWLLVCRELMC